MGHRKKQTLFTAILNKHLHIISHKPFGSKQVFFAECFYSVKTQEIPFPLHIIEQGVDVFSSHRVKFPENTFQYCTRFFEYLSFYSKLQI